METALAIATVVTGTLGYVSLRQAAYFDGDRDAHAGRSWRLLHVPVHPFAVRARKRGLRLLIVAVGLGAALLLSVGLRR